MLETFQRAGKQPVMMDSLDTDGAILWATDFSIFADTGPDDLFASRVTKRCSTSSAVIKQSSRQQLESATNTSRSEKLSEGMELLKHFFKNSERTSAFS